eukprot:Gb_28328 [translate_table: standard]
MLNEYMHFKGFYNSCMAMLTESFQSSAWNPYAGDTLNMNSMRTGSLNPVAFMYDVCMARAAKKEDPELIKMHLALAIKFNWTEYMEICASSYREHLKLNSAAWMLFTALAQMGGFLSVAVFALRTIVWPAICLGYAIPGVPADSVTAAFHTFDEVVQSCHIVVVHPFAEHLMYVTMFSIAPLAIVVTNTASVRLFFGKPSDRDGTPTADFILLITLKCMPTFVRSFRYTIIFMEQRTSLEIAWEGLYI